MNGHLARNQRDANQPFYSQLLVVWMFRAKIIRMNVLSLEEAKHIHIQLQNIPGRAPNIGQKCSIIR